MRLTQLSSQSFAFPSPELALREPNGLLALGAIYLRLAYWPLTSEGFSLGSALGR